MSDMYVITATSVHYSDVANVIQLYMYCNSTLFITIETTIVHVCLYVDSV